jgi:hypothetical protein
MTKIQPDEGMIPVELAAERLGITPSRLLGFIARNGATDPVGNYQWVYEDTLASLRKRLAVLNSGMAAPDPGTADSATAYPPPNCAYCGKPFAEHSTVPCSRDADVTTGSRIE